MIVLFNSFDYAVFMSGILSNQFSNVLLFCHKDHLLIAGRIYTMDKFLSFLISPSGCLLIIPRLVEQFHL